MSEAVTEGVRVSVRSQYVPDRSNSDENFYFFVYEVTLENLGDQAVQLISRHWVITDADGQVREVAGPGVVGEQPRLEPGERYRYASACPLNTPVGTMHGTYQMVRDDDRSFDAEVAVFRLAVPGVVH